MAIFVHDWTGITRKGFKQPLNLSVPTQTFTKKYVFIFRISSINNLKKCIEGDENSLQKDISLRCEIADEVLKEWRSHCHFP